MIPTTQHTPKVPKLRFPGFVGEWEEKKLGKILSIKNGWAFKSEYFSEDRSYILLTPGNFIENGGFTLRSENDRGYSGDFPNEYLLNKGDIIIPMTEQAKGLLGTSAIIPESNKYLLNQRLGLLKFRNEELYDKYIAIFFNLFHTKKYISQTSVGTKVKHTSPDKIYKYKSYFPQLPEQQKIADFLSVVDEKIESLEEKKSSLQEYKKGMMQKIFSQEVRFKNEDGEDFGDWEEKRLGDIAEIYDGTHQTPKYTDGGVPFYSVEHLTRNQFENTKYISEEVFLKESERVEIEKGDILMTRIGDIGTPKLINWNVRASFYVSLALIKVNKNIKSTFLTHLIKSEFFQRQLWSRTIHVAFPKKINLGEIGKCKVLFPSLPEQQKIADFLSDLDEKIESVESEIVSAKEWKKGLLQGMFV